MSWTPERLAAIDAARELEISVSRADGTSRPWAPIWVVRLGDDVFVRTWYRRDTGWYGDALRTGRARVRVPGVKADVGIDAVGVERRGDVDEAYRAKYGDGPAERMVDDEAATTTLRLRSS